MKNFISQRVHQEVSQFDISHLSWLRRVRFYFSEYRVQIKYAWQRAFRGYEDEEIYNLGRDSIRRFIFKLKILRNQPGFALIKPNSYENMSDEDKDVVINQIIYLLEHSDPSAEIDRVELQIGAKNMNVQMYSRIVERSRKNFRQALDILKDYMLGFYC